MGKKANKNTPLNWNATFTPSQLDPTCTGICSQALLQIQRSQGLLSFIAWSFGSPYNGVWIDTGVRECFVFPEDTWKVLTLFVCRQKTSMSNKAQKLLKVWVSKGPASVFEVWLEATNSTIRGGDSPASQELLPTLVKWNNFPSSYTLKGLEIIFILQEHNKINLSPRYFCQCNFVSQFLQWQSSFRRFPCSKPFIPAHSGTPVFHQGSLKIKFRNSHISTAPQLSMGEGKNTLRATLQKISTTELHRSSKSLP